MRNPIGKKKNAVIDCKLYTKLKHFKENMSFP